MQIFYGLLAIMVLGILSLTMNRTMFGSEETIAMNEYATQMTGIANEFLDQINSLPYDAITISGIIVKTTTSLANPIMGAPACNLNKEAGVDQYFKGCLAMNDLHGKNATRTVEGLNFDVEVRMWYVDPVTGNTSATPTFRKRTQVMVKTGDIRMGVNNDSLKIQVYRDFNYPRVIG